MRFGVSMWKATDGKTWREDARRFEGLGFDTLWVPDHVGMFDPFVGLAAAAGATESVRLGSYVLNAEFWNPLLLAGEQGDLVGLVGFTSGTGQVHTDLSHWGWDGLAERLAHARSAAAAATAAGAGGRAFEADVLVQRVAVTDDPAGALADFVEAGLSEEMFDSPFLLVGTETEIVERLHRLAELGIGGVTTFAAHGDALATAIPHFR